jgi:hypothetical protein
MVPYDGGCDHVLIAPPDDFFSQANSGLVELTFTFPSTVALAADSSYWLTFAYSGQANDLVVFRGTTPLAAYPYIGPDTSGALPESGFFVNAAQPGTICPTAQVHQHPPTARCQRSTRRSCPASALTWAGRWPMALRAPSAAPAALRSGAARPSSRTNAPMRCLPSRRATARSARSARTASTQTRHAQVIYEDEEFLECEEHAEQDAPAQNSPSGAGMKQ